MKYFIFLTLSLLISCAGARQVNTWVDLNGNFPAPEVLEAALTKCDFEKKARVVKSLNDLAYQEAQRRIRTGGVIDQRRKIVVEKENQYYVKAESIAKEISECMYNEGMVAILLPKNSVQELNEENS